MAAGPIQPCHGFCERCFFLSLMVLCGFLASDSVKVTQEPPFANSQGENLVFRCSVDESNFHFFWYRQLPGEVELQVVGSLYTYNTKLEEAGPTWKERLTGNWEGVGKKAMSLHLRDLHQNDSGLYLCAVNSGSTDQAYFAERGTQVLVQEPGCELNQSTPSALLLGPTCHKKSTTLVCLAQGFFYQWPLEVSWKRDGQEVPRLSVATEEAQKQDRCSFGIASRLAVAAEEWRHAHTYSCHVSQGHITAKAEMTSWQKSDSGFSGIGHSLRVGQLIFLLLAVKSFAYGTVLGVYTVCRKRGL